MKHDNTKGVKAGSGRSGREARARVKRTLRKRVKLRLRGVIRTIPIGERGPLLVHPFDAWR